MDILNHATLTNTCAYCPKYQSDMQHLRVCMYVYLFVQHSCNISMCALLVTEQTLQVCQLAYTLSRPVHTHTQPLYQQPVTMLPTVLTHDPNSVLPRPSGPLCLPYQFSFDVAPKMFHVVPNSAQTTPTHSVLVLYTWRESCQTLTPSLYGLITQARILL